MEGPFVSVILPTYNRAAYLPMAMESVLSQEYRNLELIIVDDGSSDNTRELVEGFHDERILFMRTPVNRGVAAARNAGIRRAKGKYIAFQDSDDIWLPGKLAKQVEVLEHSMEDTALVYHIMTRTHRTGKKYIIPEKEVGKEARQGKLFEKLLAGNYIGMPTICIRSSVLKGTEGVGMFDLSIPSFEDYELLLRVAKKYPIEYIDEVLVDTYALSDGTNNDVLHTIISNCFIIQKYKEDMRRLGIYERKVQIFRELGALVGMGKQVEEIIQKYCGGENE